MNHWVYAGLDKRKKAIPVSELGKIETILNLSKELFNVRKRNKNAIAPERYIGLLVAKELLNYENTNILAKNVEGWYDFPKRSGILTCLRNYSELLKVNKNFREKYYKLLELSKEKLKINN
jgi:hypothetical protein